MSSQIHSFKKSGHGLSNDEINYRIEFITTS